MSPGCPVICHSCGCNCIFWVNAVVIVSKFCFASQLKLKSLQYLLLRAFYFDWCQESIRMFTNIVNDFRRYFLVVTKFWFANLILGSPKQEDGHDNGTNSNVLKLNGRRTSDHVLWICSLVCNLLVSSKPKLIVDNWAVPENVYKKWSLR